jgi:hypothetical protein
VATNKLTKATVQALRENSSANAKLTKATVQALRENSSANAKLTKATVFALIDPPTTPTARRIFCQVIG